MGQPASFVQAKSRRSPVTRIDDEQQLNCYIRLRPIAQEQPCTGLVSRPYSHIEDMDAAGFRNRAAKLPIERASGACSHRRALAPGTFVCLLKFAPFATRAIARHIAAGAVRLRVTVAE